MEPLRPPVQLGEVTEEELKQYDGADPKKPLLMAIKGQIYDVSQSRVFYGPGGPYHLFAGKDASRALAKMSFEEKYLTGDVSGLGVFELQALKDWEYKFMSRYVKVGTVKKSVPVTDGKAIVEAAEGTSEAAGGENNPAEIAEHESGRAIDIEDGPSGNVESKTDGDGGDKKEWMRIVLEKLKDKRSYLVIGGHHLLF